MTVHKNYIDGQWRDGVEVWENVNPSDTSDVVGAYAFADADQAREAIVAARTAFPSWSRSPLELRAEILERIGNEVVARREELGELLSREEGKIRAEGIGEVDRAASFVKYLAGEVFRIEGSRLTSVRPGIEVETTRAPLGVIAGITPWNYPLANGAYKIAASIAYGNCVVLKPSEFAPGSAWAFAEIISRSGLPAGVFNLVMGKGETAGEAIATSPNLDGVTFTGSVSIGRLVLENAAKHRAKVQLELGGKNPLIVLDDADPEVAVDVALYGAFSQTGQRCTASSRLIVTKGIYGQFVDSLAERTKAMVVDHALDPESEVGPVVNERQLEKDLSYVALGRQEGAKHVCGGEPVNRETEGYFLSPALFVDASNDMRISREEIFGPVTTVIPANDYEDALEIANDTEFGLSSGIVTTSLKYADHFKRHSEAGVAMINLPTAGIDYHVPFGGRKASGYGPREHGRTGSDFFTDIRTSYTAASP